MSFFAKRPFQAVLACTASLWALTPAAAATDTILHQFSGGADSGYPIAGLLNYNAVFYGTTSGTSGNNGTVFSVTPKGVETVLHNFAGAPGDGANPYGTLINVNGTFYGTTNLGGAYNEGTVFSITPSGAFTILYSFGTNGAADGSGPQAGVTYVNGTLYGTTAGGGPNGTGTIFALTLTGTETVLYAFGPRGKGDGYNPVAPLYYAAGRLFGTTEYGGATNGVGCGSFGCGTVFQITPAGAYKILHKFGGGTKDGQWPDGGLVSIGAVLYGTTEGCGANDQGIVFQMSFSGYETVLHSFAGSADGANPVSNLIVYNGALYGTTSAYGPGGGGTVFELSTTGTETTLYSFNASNPADGNSPNAGLTYSGGKLYGTTNQGGTPGVGTVFSVPQ